MNIKNILKESGKSVTKERIDIFDYVNTRHIFTSNDLLENFKNIWRASIFRTLNLFVEIWVVRKVNLWEKIESYEVNNENHHHEHMKCEKCKSVLNFHSDDIYNQLFNKAKELWFSIKSHNIWISWVCKKCL